MRDALMQTAEAAELAGVTPDAIRRAVREGRLRVAATTGRGIQLYVAGDVDAYRAARQARSERRKHARRQSGADGDEAA